MINSEHDLWRLFDGEGPDAPGRQELTFRELHDQTTVLDVGGKDRSKPYRLRFKLTDTTRFYKLRCLDIEAVVDQSRLLATARRMSDPSLKVIYLGCRAKP